MVVTGSMSGLTEDAGGAEALAPPLERVIVVVRHDPQEAVGRDAFRVQLRRKPLLHSAWRRVLPCTSEFHMDNGRIPFVRCQSDSDGTISQACRVFARYKRECICTGNCGARSGAPAMQILIAPQPSRRRRRQLQRVSRLSGWRRQLATQLTQRISVP